MKNELEKFIEQGKKLNEVWDNDMINNYPKYLPSFDEFLNDLINMNDSLIRTKVIYTLECGYLTPQLDEEQINEINSFDLNKLQEEAKKYIEEHRQCSIYYAIYKDIIPYPNEEDTFNIKRYGYSDNIYPSKQTLLEEYKSIKEEL